MITDSRWVTGCPVLSPNVPFRPERFTGERLKGGDGRNDDAIAAAAAEEEVSDMRAREKEELVAVALFIADM